jgi:hypothetical protein
MEEVEGQVAVRLALSGRLNKTSERQTSRTESPSMSAIAMLRKACLASARS